MMYSSVKEKRVYLSCEQALVMGFALLSWLGFALAKIRETVSRLMEIKIVCDIGNQLVNKTFREDHCPVYFLCLRVCCSLFSVNFYPISNLISS